jgi:glycosyltransferase involved in cell wall biosynthesis
MASVSVIIPAYNRAGIIGRAIDSVLAQTFDDLEILVIDDGSTDDTVATVRSIGDDRIRCIECKSNRGAGAARNKGIREARGKYVAFLDSDDEWLPEKLQRQVTLMESLPEDWGISCTGAKILKDGCRETVVTPNPNKAGNVYRHYVFGRIYTPTPTLMLRREVFDRVGCFDDKLWRGQDVELLLRVCREHKLAVLPEPLAIVHLATTKRLSNLVEPARLRILEKHAATVREQLGWYAERHFRAHTLWLIADLKFRDQQRLGGLKYWMQSMAATPLMSPKRYARMMLAASGLLPHVKRALWSTEVQREPAA